MAYLVHWMVRGGHDIGAEEWAPGVADELAEAIVTCGAGMLAEARRVELVRMLGARPERLVHKAAAGGDAGVVRWCVEEQAELLEALDEKSGDTPLVSAARAGRVRCVVALLDCGADIGRRERDTEPPLVAAADGTLMSCGYSWIAEQPSITRRAMDGPL